MRFVRFSYYKTANRTTPYNVVRCGAVIPFCGWFWCGLVNTPSSRHWGFLYIRFGNMPIF